MGTSERNIIVALLPGMTGRPIAGWIEFSPACYLRAWLMVIAIGCRVPAAAEEIRVDLDRRDDPRVTPRLEDGRFAIAVNITGHLQKLEPTTIQINTQQKGRWSEPRLESGRYLTVDFDEENPQRIRVETTLKFDLAAGEQRFAQERDRVQREVQKRAGGKEGAAAKARSQVLIERIAAVRDENIKAGADKRGKASLHSPPLPRQPLNFEKPETLERLLKEQCWWQSVAEIFKATQFQPPDEKEHPDFASSLIMAEEIRQAMMGIKFNPRFLSDSQYKALEQGSRFQFTGRFLPEVANAADDMQWRSAPAVRLADGIVKRATIEGSLDRARDQTVAWWRVECESPNRVQFQMVKGEGDCFWTWVETPDDHVRYIRLLLHSPGTRYRGSLSILGAAKGEEVTLYDGPVNVPIKAPF